ncbi:hypothetical protein V3M41_01465 [Trueperella pyogenes]|uniref:hypothetical protein n=1 Tax=Trueperella pyogenes TaxID=1661 RepID=UPI00345DC723
MGLSPRLGHIDPMEYDILLELATRIGGTYMGWAYETEGVPDEQHWREEAIKVRQAVWSVDSSSASEIRRAQAQLIEICENLPHRRPRLVA